MIHWLLLPASELPRTADNHTCADWLGPGEAAICARLTLPARRSEWLLGRYAARLLVRQWLAASAGEPDDATPFTAIEILPDGDGAPTVCLRGRPLPLCLSISHSHGTAFCALMQRDDPGETLGVDLELIAPRGDAFVREFLTPREQARVQAALPAARDRLVTATWSAKEAVLKALRTGTRIDTRQVECLLDEPADLPDGSGWSSFEITLDPALTHPLAGGRWLGRWRLHGDFVLAMAERSSAGRG